MNTHADELPCDSKTKKRKTTMLALVIITFQLFYSVTCSISCYNCPLGPNTFDAILTADSLPETFNNCSFETEQSQCSLLLIFTRDPDRTQILATGGEERRGTDDENHLKNEIIFGNDGTKLLWTNRIRYICSDEKCNSPSTLKRLFKSLKSEDNFNEFTALLKINQDFNGTFCFFFANSSASCQTEVDPNNCTQCVIEQSIQSQSLDICADCIKDDVIENFISYETKFSMNTRERRDFWIIECQSPDCNTIQTIGLIRNKSDVQFDFNRFLNNSRKQFNLSFIHIVIFILIVLNIKINDF